MANVYPEFCIEKAYVFRIVHRENLADILANGARCRSDTASNPYVNIGNAELIEKRKTRAVPIAPGGTLSDYVPFYFTPRSPMLLNILTGYNGITQRARQDIVILVSSVARLAETGATFLFTDRHAYLASAQFFADPARLDRIDWDILYRSDFSRSAADPGKQERYQAELLVRKIVSVHNLLGLACYDQATKGGIEAMTSKAGLTLQAIAKPTWYP